MAENYNHKEESFFTKYKWYLIGLAVFLIYMMITNSENTPVNSETTEVEQTEEIIPTEGVITKVAEVEPEVFKITNEEVVPTVDDSRVIATYLDGKSDTFTLTEIAVIDTTITSEDNNYRRRSGISTIVHYGLIGYMLGRPMGYPISRSAYSSNDSYNRSNSGRTQVSSSATRRTVSTPKPTSTGKTGFGSGKSTKSYGG